MFWCQEIFKKQFLLFFWKRSFSDVKVSRCLKIWLLVSERWEYDRCGKVPYPKSLSFCIVIKKSLISHSSQWDFALLKRKISYLTQVSESLYCKKEKSHISLKSVRLCIVKKKNLISHSSQWAFALSQRKISYLTQVSATLHYHKEKSYISLKPESFCSLILATCGQALSLCKTENASILFSSSLFGAYNLWN